MTDLPDVERRIGNLEGKMDLMIAGLDRLDSRFISFESGRLSTLEVKFATLTGKLTVIIALVSGATSFAFLLLEKFLIK